MKSKNEVQTPKDALNSEPDQNEAHVLDIDTVSPLDEDSKEIIKALEEVIKIQEAEISALKQALDGIKLPESAKGETAPDTPDFTFSYGDSKYRVVSGVFMRTTGDAMENLKADDIFRNTKLREYLADAGSSCIEKI